MKLVLVCMALGLLLASCADTRGTATSPYNRDLPKWDPMAPPDRGIEGGSADRAGGGRGSSGGSGNKGD